MDLPMTNTRLSPIRRYFAGLCLGAVVGTVLVGEWTDAATVLSLGYFLISLVKDVGGQS